MLGGVWELTTLEFHFESKLLLTILNQFLFDEYEVLIRQTIIAIE